MEGSCGRMAEWFKTWNWKSGNCHQKQPEGDRRMQQKLQQGTWSSPANRRAGWSHLTTATGKGQNLREH